MMNDTGKLAHSEELVVGVGMYVTLNDIVRRQKTGGLVGLKSLPYYGRIGRGGA
jgi:hypothetical protein